MQKPAEDARIKNAGKEKQSLVISEKEVVGADQNSDTVQSREESTTVSKKADAKPAGDNDNDHEETKVAHTSGSEGRAAERSDTHTNATEELTNVEAEGDPSPPSSRSEGTQNTEKNSGLTLRTSSSVEEDAATTTLTAESLGYREDDQSASGAHDMREEGSVTDSLPTELPQRASAASVASEATNTKGRGGNNGANDDAMDAEKDAGAEAAKAAAATQIQSLARRRAATALAETRRERQRQLEADPEAFMSALLGEEEDDDDEDDGGLAATSSPGDPGDSDREGSDAEALAAALGDETDEEEF